MTICCRGLKIRAQCQDHEAKQSQTDGAKGEEQETEPIQCGCDNLPRYMFVEGDSKGA